MKTFKKGIFKSRGIDVAKSRYLQQKSQYSDVQAELIQVESTILNLEMK